MLNPLIKYFYYQSLKQAMGGGGNPAVPLSSIYITSKKESGRKVGTRRVALHFEADGSGKGKEKMIRNDTKKHLSLTRGGNEEKKKWIRRSPTETSISLNSGVCKIKGMK